LIQSSIHSVKSLRLFRGGSRGDLLL
jgi:hypothetical protein